MNPSSTSRPRLVCRLARRSFLGFGATHLATCDDCLAFSTDCDDLDALLRRDAAPLRQAPADGIELSIIRAVRQSRPAAVRRSNYARRGLLSFAGVAAGAALAIFVSTRVPSPRDHDLAAHGAADATELVNAATTFSSHVWRSLQPSAAELSQNNPLLRELDSVYSDAQSALGFLALNFLPAASTTGAGDASDQLGGAQSDRG